MVYWITGRKDSGKTVYAYNLAHNLKKMGVSTLILDGDEVRAVVPADFTDKGRHDHIIRIAGFASIAEAQGIIVIIALVSPRKAWRQEARKLFKKSKLIYMAGGELWPGTTYEEPDKEELLHHL